MLFEKFTPSLEEKIKPVSHKGGKLYTYTDALKIDACLLLSFFGLILLWIQGIAMGYGETK